MKKGLVLALVGASLLVAALVAIQQSTAGRVPVTSGPPGARGPDKPNRPLDQPFTLENRKLELTSIAYNDRGRTIPPEEYTFVHRPIALKCPVTTKSSTCTFSAEVFVQFAAEVTGDDWTVCLEVDGVLASEPACGWYETDAVAGEVSARSFTQSMSGIPGGDHGVQALAYSTGGGRITGFTVVYRVYTP